MQAEQFYHQIDVSKYTMVSLHIKNFTPLVWDQYYQIRKYIQSLIQSALISNEMLFEKEDDFLIFLLHRNYIQWIHDLDDEIQKAYAFHFACGINIIDIKDDFQTSLQKANFALSNGHDHHKYTTTYEFYTKDLYEQRKKKEHLSHDLSYAFHQNCFQIFLQPKVDTYRKQIVGAEALLRLFYHHKEIPLSSFISLVNENTFIRTLDLFVVKKVCEYLVQAAQKQLPLLPISINISPASFSDGKYYLKALHSIIQSYDIDPHLINFELHEDIVLTTTPAHLSFMNDLIQSGHKLSLDDFGSGYSSLSVLNDLPISTIKLDQSFFKTTFTPRKKSLLDHIIRFLHANHYEIIAEGVEQEAMYQYCLNHHIPIIQGYYFYPALSIKEFNNLLENQKNA